MTPNAGESITCAIAIVVGGKIRLSFLLFVAPADARVVELDLQESSMETLYRSLVAGFGQRVSMGDCRTIGSGKCLDRLESAIEKQYVCSSIVTFAWVWD